jgi:threonine synthase
MLYFSTNHAAPAVTLKEAVTRGLAPDKGLYMPEHLPQLPHTFFRNLSSMSLQEISLEVATALFGEDIPANDLRELVYDTLSFEIPLVPVAGNISALELFHGPTMAFKDVGARFMARLLGYFTRNSGLEINVLVATSGDTGSAVANGFFKVPGIRVFVLYPKGLVSSIQEMQFTTLGENITAIEVEGTFDDCQALVKSAFLDPTLTSALTLTSANSINQARLLPQSFYYFHGFARMKDTREVVCSVPSGNFGNLCAGLIAKKMGLPIHRFLAATNVNDIVPAYLKTGNYEPRPSVATIANAMDVGDPSNFARISQMYGNALEALQQDITGYSYTDQMVRSTILEVYRQHGYLLDPHGAIGFRALRDYLAIHSGAGFFIETAHPAKFTEVVQDVIGEPVALPDTLARFCQGRKSAELLPARFEAFRDFLMSKV